MAFEAPQFVREQVRLGALRWLHSLDLNPISRTYGFADRDYWSWKTKDFSNGTWQGGISGFLDASDTVELDRRQLREVTRATLAGTLGTQRSNGSFEEAYPRESSHAVTGLVLFNWAYAYLRYPWAFNESDVKGLRILLERGLRFLEKNPESHGVIANHLCTTVMLFSLAREIVDIKSDVYSIDSLLRLQDRNEGWFCEYGGADPGYQLLTNHYMIAAQLAHGVNPRISEALTRSNSFIQNFCFPDGSFSGEIGSRGTSIFYPGGAWNLFADGKWTASPMLNWFFDRHSHSLSMSTPTNADSGNFVPIFNDWALAYQLQSKIGEEPKPLTFGSENFREFSAAKMIVASTSEAMMSVSLSNGALRRCVKDDHGAWVDASKVAFTQGDYSTQTQRVLDYRREDGRLVLSLGASRMSQTLNNAFTSSILRGLSFALYLFPPLQRLLKRMMAYLVMNRVGRSAKSNIQISIDLKSPALEVTCNAEPSWVDRAFGYHRHMASANTFDPRAL